MKHLGYIRKEYPITEIAYLAGIIDGEGSIYIGNFSSNPRTGAKYYQTNIQVTNTDKDLIDWLNKIFSGRVYEYTVKQTPKNSRKTVYRWIATGDTVTHLCELIQPFVITKKKQVEIMLKMRATFTETGMHKGKASVNHLPQDILEARLVLFNEMRALHCRNYLPKGS